MSVKGKVKRLNNKIENLQKELQTYQLSNSRLRNKNDRLKKELEEQKADKQYTEILKNIVEFAITNHIGNLRGGMQIADERDEACKDIKKKDKQIEKYQNMLVTNDMLHVIECENKDKIIDLMAEFLNKRSWREHQLKNDTCYCCKIEYGADDCKDCIKQYFENKAKELINK